MNQTYPKVVATYPKVAVYLAIIAGGWAWVMSQDYQAELVMEAQRKAVDRDVARMTPRAKCAPSDAKDRPLSSTLILTADWEIPKVRCVYARKSA